MAIAIERRKKPKHGKARWVKVMTLGRQQLAGNQSTPFSGKLRGKPLAAGRYRATITATDAVDPALGSEAAELSNRQRLNTPGGVACARPGMGA